MQLLVHIGLNKAGSTFAQHVLEANVDVLRRQHILYPTLTGPADAGNAGQLALDLRDLNRSAVLAALTECRRPAVEAGCSRVLLSSESLYHQLVRREQLEVFKQACSTAGFHSVRILSIFRHPVDHAISCFCHRAGSPSTKMGFEQWLASSYEFPRELPGFLGTVLADEAFETSGVALEAIPLIEALSKFVGVELRAPEGVTRANVSVTATEAEFIRRVASTDQRLAEMLKRRLKLLSPDVKRPDDAIRNVWKQNAHVSLGLHVSTIRELEVVVGYHWMSPTEISGCVLPHGDSDSFDFSFEQLEQVSLAVRDCGLTRRARRGLARRLPAPLIARVRNRG
jgi:hypothetical protein